MLMLSGHEDAWIRYDLRGEVLRMQPRDPFFGEISTGRVLARETAFRLTKRYTEMASAMRVVANYLSTHDIHDLDRVVKRVETAIDAEEAMVDGFSVGIESQDLEFLYREYERTTNMLSLEDWQVYSAFVKPVGRMTEFDPVPPYFWTAPFITTTYAKRIIKYYRKEGLYPRYTHFNYRFRNLVFPSHAELVSFVNVWGWNAVFGGNNGVCYAPGIGDVATWRYEEDPPAWVLHIYDLTQGGADQHRPLAQEEGC